MCVWYLLPLNHLLVKIIWEGPHGAVVPGACRAREHAVFVDEMTAADGHQRHTVTTQTFIQVYVPGLDLVIHRNGPAGKDTRRV